MNPILPNLTKLSTMATTVSLFLSSCPLANATATSHVASVKDYGAAGDGVTDDTSAINKAAISGNVVYFPAGRYLVSSTIIIASNSALYGAGAGLTIIQAKRGFVGPVVSFGVLSSKIGASSNASLSGLTVDGGATALVDGSPGVEVPPRSNNIQIYNTEVRHAAASGIVVRGNSSTVKANYVHDNWSNGIFVTGTLATSSANATGQNILASGDLVANNALTNNSLVGAPPKTGAGHGIALGSLASNCLVQANAISGNDIFVIENVASSTGNQILANSVSKSNSSGITVAGAERNFKVNNNQVIGGAGGWDIVINGPVMQASVDGNVLDQATSGGINITETNSAEAFPNGVDVEGNAITCKTGQSPVRVAPGCTNVVDKNNIIVFR